MEWHVALIPALLYVFVVAAIITFWVMRDRKKKKLSKEDLKKFEELLKKAAEE